MTLRLENELCLLLVFYRIDYFTTVFNTVTTYETISVRKLNLDEISQANNQSHFVPLISNVFFLIKSERRDVHTARLQTPGTNALNSVSSNLNNIQLEILRTKDE